MKMYLFVCGLLAVAAPAFGAAGPDDPDFVVAKVNGQPITRAELDARLAKATRSAAGKAADLPAERRTALMWQLLDIMVTEKVMQQAVRDSGVKADETKVDELIARLKQESGSDAEFNKALERRGLTELELRDDVRFQMGLQQMVESKSAPTLSLDPNAAMAYYNEHPDFWKRGDSVEARHILVLVDAKATDTEKADKKKAIDAAYTRVTGGEDFGAVAREVSEDPGSKARGGELGSFTKGQMVPEFEQFAFSLKPGQVSPVFSTQYGYHFLQVTGVQPARTVPFEEVKERIERLLNGRKRQENGSKMVQEFRKAATIEILMPGSPPPSGALQGPGGAGMPQGAPAPQ